ncbi:MAG: hypothetical protein ND866_16975 [Pyrinomonadaceae bacterium]|nr:hypothetical protein [Pyrinomonadaceae bacterium]
MSLVSARKRGELRIQFQRIAQLQAACGILRIRSGEARTFAGRSRGGLNTKVSSIPSSDRSDVARPVSCDRGDHHDAARTTEPPRHGPKRKHRFTAMTVLAGR